jgi:hypothetical protein
MSQHMKLGIRGVSIVALGALAVAALSFNAYEEVLAAGRTKTADEQPFNKVALCTCSANSVKQKLTSLGVTAAGVQMSCNQTLCLAGWNISCIGNESVAGTSDPC